MNYEDVTMMILLIFSTGIVAYLIGFGMGNRSAYSDVNSNLGSQRDLSDRDGIKK